MTAEELAQALDAIREHAQDLTDNPDRYDRSYVMEDTLARLEQLATRARGQQPERYAFAYPMPQEA